MPIAILYTGLERTLEDTLPYFKKNVLLNNNVHVYCVIQTTNYEKVSNLLKTYMDDNMKGLEWFDNNDMIFRCIQTKLLDNMNINDGTKEYLRSSGSMIEYYQLWLAYIMMCRKENYENFKYDYVIRQRTDIVVNKPVDFKWLDLGIDEIVIRLDMIYQKKIDTKSNDSVLNVFMNTLIDFGRLNTSVSNNIIINKKSRDIRKLLNDENFNNVKNINELKEYIKNGKYLISIRANLFYIIKRDYFTFIPAIGTNYGTYKSFDDNNYWWNAESQFRLNCLEQLITIFDSTSNLEEKSLYNYDKNNYFDSNNEVMVNNDFYCFIKRN
jgi:hypothetical protein